MLKPNLKRVNQLVFCVGVLISCWHAMLMVHELGHSLAALATGGNVVNVFLEPFSISRTDVSPNPHPGWVVWAGPIFGCAFPVLLANLVPKHQKTANRLAWFFSGFCLIANGAYLGFGAHQRVGDCAVMLQTGSSLTTLISFGALSVAGGILIWHRLGSIGSFFRSPELITFPMTCLTTGITLAILTVGFWISQVT